MFFKCYNVDPYGALALLTNACTEITRYDVARLPPGGVRDSPGESSLARALSSGSRWYCRGHGAEHDKGVHSFCCGVGMARVCALEKDEFSAAIK